MRAKYGPEFIYFILAMTSSMRFAFSSSSLLNTARVDPFTPRTAYRYAFALTSRYLGYSWCQRWTHDLGLGARPPQASKSEPLARYTPFFLLFNTTIPRSQLVRILSVVGPPPQTPHTHTRTLVLALRLVLTASPTLEESTHAPYVQI